MVVKLGEKKKEKEKEKKDNETDELLSMLSVASERPEMRALALYGDVNEEKCVEVVYALLSLDFSTNTTVQMSTEDNTIESFQLISIFQHMVAKQLRCFQSMTP